MRSEALPLTTMQLAAMAAALDGRRTTYPRAREVAERILGRPISLVEFLGCIRELADAGLAVRWPGSLAGPSTYRLTIAGRAMVDRRIDN